jgi:hypothetical protein
MQQPQFIGAAENYDFDLTVNTGYFGPCPYCGAFLSCHTLSALSSVPS